MNPGRYVPLIFVYNLRKGKGKLFCTQNQKFLKYFVGLKMSGNKKPKRETLEQEDVDQDIVVISDDSASTSEESSSSSNHHSVRRRVHAQSRPGNL